jgi:hypothetical protein
VAQVANSVPVPNTTARAARTMRGMNTTTPAGRRFPPIDVDALERGDALALATAMAHLAARLYLRAGTSIKLPMAAVDVSLLPSPQAALLAAGVELCGLLARSPQGRQALRDFGFEPVFHDVESK